MKRILLILLVTFLCNGIYPQSVTNLEYFFDIDPGLGNGTALDANVNTGALTQTYNIATENLDNGLHNLFVRAFNENETWSHYDRKLVYVTKIQNTTQNIIQAEYYFDIDPGFGNATVINVPSQDAFTTTLDISQEFEEGIHKLFVRVKSQDDIWSHYDQKLFYVLDNSETSLIEYEYFIDTDDEIFSVTATNQSGQVINNIDTFGLTQGTHYFFIRAKNSDGTWSIYDMEEFEVGGFLSIPENVYNSISVYPNPTQDIVNISSALDLNITKISIFDTRGKTVFESSKNMTEINVSTLSSGVYILKLHSDLGSVSYKLLKK